jgi:hypothetical protein
MACISLSDQCEMRYCGRVSLCNEMQDTPILRVSYPILQAKPSTHRICAQDYLFHTHGHKMFTDSQIL